MFVTTVLWITVKRMVHNWRVTLGILFGVVLAAGIISSIPVYSSGSLHRSFMEAWVELRTGRPPFALITVQSNERYRYRVGYEHIVSARERISRDLRRAVGYEAQLSSEYISLGSNAVLPVGSYERTLTSPRGEVAALSNLQEVAEIIAGRWYRGRDDGVVEVVVDELTFNRNELSIGDRYAYWYPRLDGVEGLDGPEGFVLVDLEVVGLFRARPGTTMADWIYPPPFFDRVFAEPDVVLKTLIRRHGLRPRTFDALRVFDHHELYVNELPGVIARLESFEESWADASPPVRLWHHPLRFFRDFDENRSSIALFLTTLSIPMVGMVLYFIALLAGISVEHRKKEIAVLRSRGSGRTQILISFLLEWIILGTVAFAVGPFTGAFLARAIGSTSGFLEFVGRRAIPAVVDARAFRYSAIAAGLAVVSGMIPVLASLRHSVVTYVRSRDRRPRVSAWHRLFLDVIILAVAIYGYSQLSWETLSVLPGQMIPADPMLFFVPVLFIVGGGLLVLRLYPLLMNLLRVVTAGLPGVVWQMTIRRLSRNAGEYVPVMLQLMVTVSLGIYSAISARTLRLNFEDNVRYAVGADVATSEEWQPPGFAGGAVTSEPQFYRREELPGVQAAARVLRGRARVQRVGRHEISPSVEMMAIEPYEFSRTAWFRRDLSAAHPYDYLGLLARHREGVIVSTAMYRQAGYELGDRVTVVYSDQEIPAYIAGHVDLWPTLNPYERPFIVMNLTHVQDYTALEPYHVWYRMHDPGRTPELVDSLVGLGVYVTRLVNTEAELVAMRREPYRMGFFGILSMGFLSALVVTSLGFLVFTVYSIRARLVQFGALRAMGFSSVQLIATLGIELIATIGVSLAVGVAGGIAVSGRFLPMIAQRAAELRPVPPFVVVARTADIHGILGVLGVVFLTALLALTTIIARLRLTNAIKLGEEA